MLENFFEPQLRAKGFKGTSQDMWSKYLSEKGFKGSIPDSEMHWLASLGFHGTLEDRYDQLFKKLGLHGTIDDMASVHGPHLNSGWETTGYVIGGVRSTLSAFAINNKQN